MVKNLWCMFFGHKEHPTTLLTWKKDKSNWFCPRCMEGFKKCEDLETHKWEAIKAMLRK